VSISWLAVVLVVGIPTLLALGAVSLVRRSERRLGWYPGEDDTPNDGPSGPAATKAVTAYLDRMASALVLPAADVAEVRAELADHIADSIASLEAEGLDVEHAIRETLARLGSPVELGLQIRAAHQSTRRLLAGAGGGVFAASGGFVLGWIAGFAMALVVIMIGAACYGLLGLAGIKVPGLDDHGGTISSLMSAGALLFAATQATRYAVRTSAGISRRTPRSIAIFWASASAVGFGWLALFMLKGPMSWPGAVAFLCVPVVAFASAFVRIDRPMPRVGRNALLAGLGGVAAIILSVGLLGDISVSISTGYETGGGGPVYQWGNLPPQAPETWAPQGTIEGGGMRSADMGGELYSAITDQMAPVSMATALTYWHDLRFEAWHAQFGDSATMFGIDSRYSSPFAVLPAEIHPSWLQAVFHFERMRDARDYEVVLTGIGPDGNRYTIADCGGAGEQFNGSVWDWITAPQ
jgi:hypothetical protein